MNAQALTGAELCPLCSQPNRCALETQRLTGLEQPPCWCTRTDFAPALLERLPVEARGRACICQACAERRPDAQP